MSDSDIGKEAESKIRSWLPVNIKEFSGNYEVSNFGDVRSTDRFTKAKHGGLRFRQGAELKVHHFTGNNQKYCYVVLSKDGFTRNVLVHRLVAGAFLPNIHNLPEVNHIDGNPDNNCVENLEWVTAKENIHKAISNGQIDILKLGRSKSVRCIQTNQIWASIKSLSEYLHLPRVYDKFLNGVATVDGFDYVKEGGH